LLAVSVGIDLRQLRELFVAFLKSWLGVSNKDKQGKD